MSQKNVWEKEYQNHKLVTGGEMPQKDVLRCLRYLKTKCNFILEAKTIVDLGSGTGRNANYLAELGNEVHGIEFAGNAVALARNRARAANVVVNYYCQSMAEQWPLVENQADLVLDITSSNSLLAEERQKYLQEMFRVLKPGGYIILKALCSEGDKNAKALIKKNPGPETNTYVMKELGLVERVFGRSDLLATYDKYFNLVNLDKKTSYTRMNGQSYKRNFWLAILQKSVL
ncbi:MAG: class I SAM-dependent methyltransferase [Candidatus Falkowbacteria bacterium]